MSPRTALALAALTLTACDSPGNTTAIATAPGDPENGQPLFAKNCAECHGATAQGGDRGPPLIHRIYHPNHHADIAFVLAARQGVRAHHWPFGDMPPQPNVSDAQIRDIVAWVRREQHRAGVW